MEGVCRFCAGKGLVYTKPKLLSLVDPDALSIALDRLYESNLPNTVPDASTEAGQQNAVWLVGATPLLPTLYARLPHLLVKVRTQHNKGQGCSHYYRPVFRKDGVEFLLHFLLGKKTPLEHHLRCLGTRWRTQRSRWNQRTGTVRRGPVTQQKFWTLVTELPPGEPLT